ncbi:uncharacterized protein [Aegilops tauschii subsp. strangulata]|uniref:uncharacterized protein n=1 Tax=Aegilops tauschii subsp. strangulata TaxID=200361 RepID=UPI001E1CA078|nr:uncharacterized protein LOC120967271 [Aegilops tauschii subsp. strangulata]
MLSFHSIAGVLDPASHYKYNFGKSLSHVNALNAALKKLASPSEFIAMIPEVHSYVNTRGAFEGMYPRNAAEKVSPTEWWITFGGTTPVLQKYAIRIVSQCTSSSDCERNWSTYALVHTLVRNRLGFEKLHKMVFCHYNLRLRIRLILGEPKEKEVDTCALLMNTTLYDCNNEIMDWLGNSTSDSIQDEDEYDGDSDGDGDCPVVLEVVGQKRSRGSGMPPSEEEEEEEDVDDGEDDEGNNDVLPRESNEPLRKSTRKRRKRKLDSF